MSRSVPEMIHEQEIFDRFWEQLDWPKLERRIMEALRHPDQAVPLETKCPAVMDLAKQIVERIGKSAITKPGEAVSFKETFTMDQRLAVLRILEAIISEYESYQKNYFAKRVTSALRPGLPSLEQK